MSYRIIVVPVVPGETFFFTLKIID